MILVLLLMLTIFTNVVTIKSDKINNTYYVAKNGKDSNPGTEAQPWLTLNKAASTLTAGDTVIVKQGTYNEQLLIRNSGSVGSPITFTTYEDDEVIIDGTGISIGWDGLIRIDDVSYVTISGFKVQNSNYFGIYCMDTCDNIIIENNKVYNCQSSGIIVFHGDGQSSNMYIRNNLIDTVCMNMNQEALSLSRVDNFELIDNKVFNSYKEGIDAKNGCRNGIIKGNEVSNYDAIRPCIYVDAYGRDSYNIIIEKNIAHHNGQGICLATEEGGTIENIKIFNNIVYSNSNGFGIHKFNTGGSHLKKDILVVNNLFYMLKDSGTCVILTDDSDHFDNLIIRNNILSGSNYHIITTTFSDYSNVIIDHNLLTSTSNYYGSNYLMGDPGFIDPENYNFNLESDSLAIDHGNPDQAPSYDYYDISRPQGSQVDIGPFEYYTGGAILISNENPTDGSADISKDITSLSVDIESSVGSLLNWRIETIPDIGSAEGSNYAGTVTCPIFDLNYSKTYTWKIIVNDGNIWKENTYSFTTNRNKYDVNNDGKVSFQDAGLCWVHRTTLVPYDSIYDVNEDYVVNFQDVGLCWVNRD